MLSARLKRKHRFARFSYSASMLTVIGGFTSSLSDFLKTKNYWLVLVLVLVSTHGTNLSICQDIHSVPALVV